MKRIEGAGHVNNRFVAEDAQAGRPPTELTEDWFNDVQEEICNVIEAAGKEVNGESQHQLKDAIKTLINSVPVADVMTGATDELGGIAGLVPAPGAGDENKILLGSGTWATISSLPVGAGIDHYGTTAPEHYLVCDGSAISRAAYPELYAVIGTIYGAGDGSTTFNLPDLIDRFAQGSTTPGQKIEAGLPNHDHSIQLSSIHGAGNDGGQRLSPVRGDLNPITVTADNASLSNPIYGASNTVQPPALTVLPCIKYE